MKQKFRRYLAMFLAFAMVFTMLPASVAKAEESAGTEVDPVGTLDEPILHWDMTTNEDGTLKDVTGNNHSGNINQSATASKIEDIDVLNLTGGYVDIPNGTIGSEDTELTVNMLVKCTELVRASWMWCLGSSSGYNIYITGNSSQNNTLRGAVTCIPDAGGNGWSYESVVDGTSGITKDEWQNITVTYKDNGSIIVYKNGTELGRQTISGGSADRSCTLQKLMTAGDGNNDRDGYMGWSFYTGADPKFQGSVADFRIYNHEMSADEVAELQEEIDEMLVGLKFNDFAADDVDLKEEDCLNDSDSKDAVTADLSLPDTTTITIEGVTVDAEIDSWKSDKPSIISESGVVHAGVFDEIVTMTASVKYKEKTVDKTLTFTVKGAATDQEIAEAVANTIEIPNKDDIRGSITLPLKGIVNGEVFENATIAWESTNEAVISSKDDGDILAGLVHRQDEDTKVTLTATVTYNGASYERKIECTVKKKAEDPVLTDYLFAYFPYANVQDERIYFGISQDGLNFTALNNSNYVLESTLGTHGLRDPFIIRSHEGDKFYLIATDLTVSGVTQDGVTYPGQNWDQNQVNGSQSIMVWESNDLVNWSEQRMCKIAADDAGCTWAPEAYWADELQQYVVFWASKLQSGGNQRVYYATTRDFYTFSEAQVWIEEEGSVIDTTVIKVGDYYYRYTKNEDGSNNKYGTPSKRVYCERSKSLTSKDWEFVNANSLAYSGGQIEGPCIFKLNSDDVENAKQIASLKDITLEGEDVYCLIADATGVTIFPGLSDDITSGKFSILGETKGASVNGTQLYSMPEPDASHGTIMPITTEEYQKVMEAYGTPSIADDAIPTYVTTGYELPDKVTVSYLGNNIEVGVTWDKTAADFEQVGTVTVKGTLTGTDNEKIDGYEFTKTFEVISDKLIYYIDSGVGSWNQNMPESSSYNAVSSIDGIALRNEVPDQTYSAENEWGVIGGDDIVGNRTSTTASIYSNGWWAKGGKNCEYVIPLENGTYSITGYFGEWWDVTRPMKFYAQYTNSEGEVVKSEEKTLTISKSKIDDTCTLQLEVKDVAEGETVDVHILSTKTTSTDPDPVIAGISVEKLSMTEEERELNAAISAFTKVGVKQTEYPLTVGESADIEIEYPESFEEKLTAAGCKFSVAYSRGNNAITVDENGKIQAVAAGTENVTVTFTLTRGSQTVKTVSKTVTVNVAKNAQQIAIDTVKADLDKISLESINDLTVGDTAEIKVVYPDGFETALKASGLAVVTKCSSQDAAVTVSENGKITAVAAGTATITITVTLNDEDNTSKALTASVTVTAKTPSEGTPGGTTPGGTTPGGTTPGGTTPGGITPGGTTAPDTTPATIKLSVKNKISIGLGESVKLTATVANKAGTTLKGQKITWSVNKSGQKVVSVKSGKITAKKTGSATITAKTSNGKTAKVKVTVKKRPTKIAVTKKSLTVKKGKTVTIKTKLTPAKAASYTTTYKSSKKKVASVSDKGVVKGLKKGTTTITVKTYNGKTAKVKVTVK